jgi:radical SAM superfamily enzyme YgiQ (UPF0313 family)
MKFILISPPYRSGEQFYIPYGMGIVKKKLNTKFSVTQLDLNAIINKINKNRKTIKKKINLGIFNDYSKFEDILFNNNDILKKEINKIVKLIKFNKNDLLGFSIHSISQLFFALCISKFIKQKHNNKIIFGGAHFLIADYHKIFSEFKFIDILTVGKIDTIFNELIKNIKHNKRTIILNKKPGKWILPDYSGLNLNNYKKIVNGKKELILPIQTSIGCNNRCCFCFFDKKIEYQKINNIINGIKYYKKKYKNKFFALINLNINIIGFPLNDLLDEIIKQKLNIKWYSRCMTNNLDEKIIKKLKQAGCYELEIGLETASLKLQKSINKKINIKNFEKMIRLLHHNKIKVDLNIIVGLPKENNIDFQNTIDFIKKNAKYINILNIRHLHLMFGSDIFKNPKKYGIIIHKNQNKINKIWGNYNFNYKNNINIKKRKIKLQNIYYNYILKKRYFLLKIIPFKLFYYLYFKKNLFKNPLINYIYIKLFKKYPIFWRD